VIARPGIILRYAGPLLLGLAAVLTACDTTSRDTTSHTPTGDRSLDSGYGVLQILLRDERHLKVLRIAKNALTLQSLSEPTQRLVDEIAATSSTALDDLDRLAALQPVITPQESLPNPIAQATLDSLRKTTATELIMSRDNFETLLLVSQAQSLRVSSHLAGELAKIDTNASRRAWLGDLTHRLNGLYDRVITRLN
jgi:hypothetical protein